MKEINLPPFYIGQNIVAIKSHSQGIFKKGDEVVVREIKFMCCSWKVDIGIVHNKGVVICVSCMSLTNTNIGWCSAGIFAPVTENFQSVSLEKVLETETPLISVN